MSQFPLDPKLSRCIIAADKLNCVEEILKIVSLLSVENIFHNPSNIMNAAKRDQAQTIRQKFQSSDGDQITLLNVYKGYVANKSSKEWCQENYLDYKNLKLAVEICKQLRDICLRNNIKLTSSQSDTVSIRLALINGLFTNTAEHIKDNEYKTVRILSEKITLNYLI
jgi:HrpA-like RNA helicase